MKSIITLDQVEDHLAKGSGPMDLDLSKWTPEQIKRMLRESSEANRDRRRQFAERYKIFMDWFAKDRGGRSLTRSEVEIAFLNIMRATVEVDDQPPTPTHAQEKP